MTKHLTRNLTKNICMPGRGGGGVKKVSHLVRGGGGAQNFHPYLGGGGQQSFWVSNVDYTPPPYINNEHSLI